MFESLDVGGRATQNQPIYVYAPISMFIYVYMYVYVYLYLYTKTPKWKPLQNPPSLIKPCRWMQNHDHQFRVAGSVIRDSSAFQV